MKSIRTRSARAAIVALAAGSLVLTGCSGDNGNKNTKDQSKSKEDAAAQSKPVQYADAAGSTGPAKDVKGATPGGTINVYLQSDLTHLDPGQIYVSDAGQFSNLIHRKLTNYQEDAEGNLTVVGDIATDSGKSSDGGKTWTYTLKDGVKDEDGNVITSADVRHTIERLYSKVIFDGPSFVQTWLSGSDYRKALPDGPYKGKHLPDTVLETPDEKTVVFRFKKAQPDLPQALAMAGYAIVPEKQDTKEKYDKAPKALGPYKLVEYKAGKSMKLVKNTNWDPKTDAVRHQYVDGYDFSSTVEQASQTKRLIADQGEAKNAIQFTTSVDPAQIQDVVSDPKVNARTIKGYQPYVWQLNFNMDRVKDKKIRDAITYALPNAAIVQTDGGKYGGEIAGGLMAPTLPGYDPNYDPFGKQKKPNGDLAKAKELVKEAGVKPGTKISYAYSNTPRGQKQQVIIKDTLGKLGFDVQAKEIDSASFYEQIGKLNNGFDLYATGWGQDWSSPSTVITPVYDGSLIADGASNYSHINDAKVNELIQKALTEEPEQAAKTWEEAHHRIVEEINPAAPMYYSKQLQLFGSNVGGARYSTNSSYININDLFLKKP
ncbi:ABC transporter substrate-binding protein [Streptomyces cyaneofuscatus]|uniref:ABC transporter substrate-binding protein n=1 Tax=Streptomyces TaxID=1883 RepID=UPI0004C7B8EB|nr:MULTISPECIES: ABC transporter substrate-binding protein [Streptomyces]ONI55450.1 putative D,D-dipeptide-binding periplasmic protein DdpA [Streptomyces sp. IB2014 011-1]RDV53592.1 ABC transporter substrate-binding protein [Streptomyces sp. IB2014 011-12]CAD5949585.1 Putative D,D-dipeptide-binding periplasmic protein DdpA [Streptomyces sp. KY70]CAD5985165.1 Putative D,D-dipeptide-binding periplasmic protein DdpA [Streptomyces sp. KY75]